MPRKKELIEGVEIIGLAAKGKAVGRAPEGYVVFVTDVVPGDVADVRLLRKRKGTWQGVAEKITTPSPDRVEPRCEHFGECGGCKWQHYAYNAQLEQKAKTVRDSFERLAKIPDINYLPILPAPEIFHYRNKIEYSFSAKRWLTQAEISSDQQYDHPGALGLHPPGNFQKVVELEKCWLQADFSNTLRNFVGEYARNNNYSFFDPLAHTGFLRNMIVRNSTVGDWMVVISFAYEEEEMRLALLEAIKDRFAEITSLHYVINRKKNDTLFDQDIILYEGSPHIVEQMGNLKFQIRPKSFFQTNSRQAVCLYDAVKTMADIQPSDVVYDLYCGLGSITLYLADQCQTIVGIEEVEDAIVDARLNAEVNGIDHSHFYAGDVRHALAEEIVSRHGRPDVIVTDPPRGGMHADVVQKLLDLAPRQIIYVSCNPATQARDVALMKDHYVVENMQPVDMFPHTSHIENIASLRRI